jgi:hypothetical protein
MHTGQNSIAPENSLPQLGQVRWGSVFMVLTAVQPQPEPKATRRSTEWCQIGGHGSWQTVVLFHKQLRVPLYYNSASNHVSEQNFHRWCPAGVRVDNDLQQSRRFEINGCEPINPAVRRTDTLSQSKGDQPELRGVKKDICTQSRKGRFASKVAKLWQVIHLAGHFSRRLIACKSASIFDFHPAGLEPATL